MREPLDTDLHMPTVLGREEAAERLLALLSAELADRVWDELIAPLYDARQMSIRWQRGQCRRCNAPHPESEFARTRKRLGHLMYCPLYVGPLEHHVVRSGGGLTGQTSDCSCGRNYRDHVWDDPRPRCPDADVDWRGPRPDGSCSVAGSETEPNNQEAK